MVDVTNDIAVCKRLIWFGLWSASECDKWISVSSPTLGLWEEILKHCGCASINFNIVDTVNSLTFQNTMSSVISNYEINKQWAVVEAVLYSRNLFWTFEVQDFLFKILNNSNQKN